MVRIASPAPLIDPGPSSGLLRDVRDQVGSITSRRSGKEPALLPQTTQENGGNRA